MNKPILLVSAIVGIAVLVAGESIGAYAQFYGSGASGGGTATPAQLEECKSLNIDPGICTDLTILAKKRLTIAQANPSTGSGTSFLTNITDPNNALGQMAIYIGALGAIFGGVAAMFFLKGRSSKQVTT